MKKVILFLFAAFLALTQIAASPAAIDFSKTGEDKNLTQLIDGFEASFNVMSVPDFKNKDNYSHQIKASKALYDSLSSQKKLNYDQHLLKLLVMRCLYNYDEISSELIEKEVSYLNKKYKKNAPHHWIYGNYLIYSGKNVSGLKEIEKYMEMNNYQVNDFFLSDYAYALNMSGKPINALYAITQCGSLSEDQVKNKHLLSLIKKNIADSSVSQSYDSKAVWRIAEEDDDSCTIYSTMLSLSVQCKKDWNLRLTPYTPGSPALCILGVNGLTLKDKNVGINIVISVFPDSKAPENYKENFIKGFPVTKSEEVTIDNKTFEKYTVIKPEIYQDERQGGLAYLYYIKSDYHPFAGARCEHITDYEKLVRSKQEGQNVSFYAVAPEQDRFKESLNMFIIVDSCNALKNETDSLLEDFFSHMKID